MQNLKHAAMAGMTATAVLMLAGCGMIKDAVDNAVEGAVEKGIEKAIEAGTEGGDVNIDFGGDGVELPAGLPEWLPIVDGEVKLSYAQDGGVAFNIESTMDEFDRVVATLEEDPDLTVLTSQDVGGMRVRAFEGKGYHVSLQAGDSDGAAVVNYVVLARD